MKCACPRIDGRLSVKDLGILTGLEWAATNAACRWLASAAGDTPFFPGDLVERLADAVRERPDAIAVARITS